MKKIFRKSYIEAIHTKLQKDSLVLLLGPRQVGKTTIMHQYADMYEYTSHYVNIEGQQGIIPEDIPGFITRLRFTYNIDLSSETTLLLLDEIQYITYPETLLKALYDDPSINCHIIATGSRFRGQQQVGSSLVGRGAQIRVRGFSFSEFLQAKGKDSLPLSSLSYPLISSYLDEYLTYGGYPAVVLAKTHKDKIDAFDAIIKRWIERDFLTYVRGGSFVDFQRLLQHISRSIGSLWKHQRLSQELSLSIYDIKKHLAFIEDSYLVVPVTPYFKDKTKEYNSHTEYFFHDHGLINYMSDQWTIDTQKGKIVENYVLTHLLRHETVRNIHYRRTKQQTEIDFIVKTYRGVYPLEVKASNPGRTPKAFHSFYTHYPEAMRGVLTSQDISEIRKTAKKDIEVKPWWLIGIFD